MEMLIYRKKNGFQIMFKLKTEQLNQLVSLSVLFLERKIINDSDIYQMF